MDEVVTFVTAYTEAEHAESVASYTETNYNRYLETQKDLKGYVQSSVTSGFSRTAFESDLYFQQFKSKADRLKPRPLFVVRKYPHHTYTDVFQAIVGGNQEGDDVYKRAIFVAEVEGALKVVSIYVIDEDDERTVEWERYRGAKIQHLNLEEPLEVRKLQAPTDPVHLEDYSKASEE